MKQKGLLITLEGNEGCGKSTQIQWLYEYLRRMRVKVFLTREPGGTIISDEIRGVLLDNKNKGMTAECETLLYMASRAQLVSEVIEPALRENYVVLCDRWLDATVAYQGHAGGVDVKWIRSLGKHVTQGIVPALSVYLDIPVEVGLQRAKSHKKADRMEEKTLAFHRKVRQGYLKIAEAEPNRFKRVGIKASDSIATVHEKIKKLVDHVLG